MFALIYGVHIGQKMFCYFWTSSIYAVVDRDGNMNRKKNLRFFL